MKAFFVFFKGHFFVIFFNEANNTNFLGRWESNVNFTEAELLRCEKVLYVYLF